MEEVVKLHGKNFDDKGAFSDTEDTNHEHEHKAQNQFQTLN